MSKIKITIEYEGEDSTPMVLRYDRASVDMSQDIYSFRDYGSLQAEALAPDGTQHISIIGVCNDARARFQELCEKYPVVDRC